MDNFFSLIRNDFLYWFPMLLGAFGALLIFILKYTTFYRAKTNTNEIVTGLINSLQKQSLIEAITLCENTPGPVARMLGSAVRAHNDGDDVREALETQAMIELPRLESFFNIFAMITNIMPLLGLFTTTLKLVPLIAQASDLSIQKISDAIAHSLVYATTGIGIAILCYIGQTILNAYAARFCHEMEIASAEIIYFFEHSEHKD